MIQRQDTASLPTDLQRRLAEVLDEYLRAVERGSPVNVDDYVARYPDLAEPIREYVSSLEWLQGGIADIRLENDPANSGVTAPLPHAELGDYRLLREVGRGGMGIVYEANQVSLDRRVALKVLPFASVLDRKQILRFQNEARAAAQLHHPNIVPVHGVGMDRGVHFYAMQFIEGRSLQQAIEELRLTTTAFASSSQMQSPPERAANTETTKTPSACRVFSRQDRSGTPGHCRTVARLGIQIAEAIHAAHDCGIVHRDIKPSNLLLDEDGKLWVTDFGLARCQAEASCTVSGEVLGTLHYMSPEQARGKAAFVDHRTDIYSLGITLYELLTLRRPFTGATYADIVRQIETGQCRRPRQENKSIPRDLENIVAKSMATCREDRYATAQDLADDLQRFLSGKPTQARPPGLAQRLGKWARRHQRSVITASVVGLVGVLTLVAGTIRLAQQMSETEIALANSRRNEQLAVANLEEARSAVDHLGSRAAELLSRVPGTENVRRELLNTVINYHNRLLANEADSDLLRSDAAIVHAKIAGIYEQLGDHELAFGEYQHAQRLYEELRDQEPSQSEHTKHLAICLNSLGRLRAKTGHHELAWENVRDAIALQNGLLDDSESRSSIQIDLARSWNNLGFIAADQGDPHRAANHYRQALGILRATAATTDDGPEKPSAMKANQALANVLHNLSLLFKREDADQALRWSDEALEIQRRLVLSHPENLEFKADLAKIYNSWATLCGASTMGLPQVVQAYTQAVQLQEELVRREPFDVAHRRNLAVTLNNKGMALTRLEKSNEAKEAFRQAIKLQRPVADELSSDLSCSSQLGGMYNNLAMLCQSLGDHQLAAKAYHAAIRCQRHAFERAPHVATFRDFLSRTYVNYGRLLRQLERPRLAVEIALRRRELWPDEPLVLFSVAEEMALSCQLETGSDRALLIDQLYSTLELALSAGWHPHEHLHDGPVYDVLRHDDRFTQLHLVASNKGYDAGRD